MSRIDYYAIAPDGLSQVMKVENYVSKAELDGSLKEYIKLRVSLINGCAYCVNMHTKDLLKMGESFEKIACVSVWNEADYFTEKEGAALELAEYVTKISEQGVPAEIYQKVRDYFSEKEYVDLILTIAQINTWNRISISMGNRATAE
ncbi:carboxymuconolactone decarboxylase family protein [Enterococcus sp. BWR-S5]|uniref:carboxymuconolactone decarboxylase family protein n=1 Tax=Enterococcus sp. BWR-S5 TaxID=2787714 RepID=UPI0019229881|nr:carboxymuconolactone decarboxylase family protein [Enterococcus sp. BWR-S5]MBL1227573.1 carboxymuconolactone decarboxylase family protein [Enterococcus sp. BWR-S5]